MGPFGAADVFLVSSFDLLPFAFCFSPQDILFMPRKKICFICLPNGLFRSLAPFESEEMEQEFSKSVHSISLAMCTIQLCVAFLV